MGKRLGLRGNDLICFAVIYGFSMDGESQFKGNLVYLSECMFASQPTVLLSLRKLLECNLILKQNDIVKGKKRCYYATNILFDDGEFEAIDTTKEPLVMTTKEPLVMTTKEPLVMTTKEPLPKEYNNKEYKEEEKNKKSISDDIPKKRFKKPTIVEIQAYIKEKKMHFDAERFFDYYECKGWVVGKSPMKDWKAACRTWEHSRKGEEKKEENTDEMPAGMTREKWMKIQEWMQERLPRIWKYIDVDAFLSMEGKSGGDRYLQRDIMLAIDRSTYEGDMVEEFERLRWTEEFKNRLPCLQ